MEKSRTIILPPGRLSLGLKEIWRYRELFYFFTWRDIKVKYKQTYLGIAWALLQPLALMFLFSFLFKRAGLHVTSIRYEIFVLSGLIVWNLFHSSVSNAAESMISQANIIKKIYFPRLIIPGSALLVALFDFCIAFMIFLAFCIYFQQAIHFSAIFIFPLGITLTLFASFGIGTFLSALNLKYRDFRYVVPFMLQVLFFASQVFYSLNETSSGIFKYLLATNPMNGIIELFRFPLTGQLNIHVLAISLASTIIFTFIGLFYFRKTEAYFADLS